MGLGADPRGADRLHTFEGTAPHENNRLEVDAAGDVDGDATDDILVSGCLGLVGFGRVKVRDLVIPPTTPASTVYRVGTRRIGVSRYTVVNPAGAASVDIQFLTETASGVLVGGYKHLYAISKTPGQPPSLWMTLKERSFAATSVPPAAPIANYGHGYPGTLGEPTLTMAGTPQPGATVTLSLGSSVGTSTLSVILIGMSSAQVIGPWGGELLVDPQVLFPVSLPATGLSFPATIPSSAALLGVDVFMQTVLIDPGASHSYSSTPGLRVTPCP